MCKSQLTISFFLTLIMVTVMIVVSGCGSGVGATPAARFTTGIYTNPSSQYGAEMELLEDGTYVSSSPNTLIPVRGTYLVTDDEVVFSETADGHCIEIPGTYKWAFDGKAITFTVVEDQCALRRIALQSGPWARQP
ncbi:MAG TPA: hypothetical protein VFZ43_04335 [Anaerolineales bacterium]